jgi:hypothetical protein
LEDGADHANATCASPVVPTTEVGESGVPTNTELDTDEYALVPALLTAATLKTYEVPFVKPVTVVADVADVPSANVDQVEPEFDENCTK